MKATRARSGRLRPRHRGPPLPPSPGPLRTLRFPRRGSVAAGHVPQPVLQRNAAVLCIYNDGGKERGERATCAGPAIGDDPRGGSAGRRCRRPRSLSAPGAFALAAVKSAVLLQRTVMHHEVRRHLPSRQIIMDPALVPPPLIRAARRPDEGPSLPQVPGVDRAPTLRTRPHSDSSCTSRPRPPPETPPNPTRFGLGAKAPSCGQALKPQALLCEVFC
ncbi:hypothetical protein SKAU_G00272520 [Synaphobranchus kaupii]|uniref:Uncharacterized protein n=1 Tax=Synaphobranchus kaupii TaxID=118154 RepID=A0A9Q1F0L8_SYNKA|nr:hypothetical protein SKAU_G00272520 [Synaphobranchus kaupii]